MPSTTAGHRLLALLVGFVLAVSGVAVTAAPAQAAWSRPGELVKYRLCKAPAGGDEWRFVSKVRRYVGTPDARASITVMSGGDREARWRSGWLERGEVQISRIRVERSPKVRVVVTQEAGDRDSVIGTAKEMVVLKPQRIRRCG